MQESLSPALRFQPTSTGGGEKRIGLLLWRVRILPSRFAAGRSRSQVEPFRSGRERECKPVLSQDERVFFLTAYSEGFNPDVLSHMVSKFMKQADLDRPGSGHLRRHTRATHMLEGGADICFIQQLPGHEKLETTGIYTQVSIEQLKAVHSRTHPAESGRKNEQDKPE